MGAREDRKFELCLWSTFTFGVGLCAFVAVFAPAAFGFASAVVIFAGGLGVMSPWWKSASIVYYWAALSLGFWLLVASLAGLVLNRK